MSDKSRPNLVLCAPRDCRIEPFRDQLAAHPAIAWISPDEAERLDTSIVNYMFDGPTFDLAAGHDPPAEATAESALRYQAWQPGRFIEFAVAQWHIARYLAGAKLIFCLRDPIETAYLRYLAHPDDMPDDFEQAIVECETAMAELGNWAARGRWSKYLAKPSPLSLLLQGGVYATPLDRCYRLLERQQVHCVSYEEFQSDPSAVLNGIWRFLDLPPGEPVATAGSDGDDSRPDEPISASARARLEEFYAEHNARLAALLGELPAAWT